MRKEPENRRKKFLKRFAVLSTAAIIAGAGSPGCGDEEVEYGPPPVEPTTQSNSHTRTGAQTQPEEPVVEYGPPPVEATE